MTKRAIILQLAFIFLILLNVNPGLFSQPSDSLPGGHAKYVFLFIGDGMGLAQVNATEAYLAALEDRIGYEHLNFTAFPSVGLVSTHANNRLITCSAAAGTALATGNKTNINRISMDPDGVKEFESIATRAHEEGYKIGIVTSVSINHATPAAFYAHQPDRNDYFEIGVDLTQSHFDYFAGGGFIEPDGTWEGKQVNVVQLAKDHGYQVINTLPAFEDLAPGPGKTLVLSPRTASEASMPYAIDMNPDDITLAGFTGKAIEMLSNEKGFFIMVEGGKIDWAGHSNDAASVVHEVIAFDEAIAEAIEFYNQHPDETLIVVTADHETGGMALGYVKTKYESNPGLLRYQKSSIDELKKIVGQFRNSKSGDPEADFNRMLRVLESDLGLNSRQYGTLLDEGELGQLRALFNESVANLTVVHGDYGESEPFMDKAIEILNHKAGISWGSSSHTGINVPVYANGTGAEKFSGYIDNTDIPRLIGELMGIWE